MSDPFTPLLVAFQQSTQDTGSEDVIYRTQELSSLTYQLGTVLHVGRWLCSLVYNRPLGKSCAEGTGQWCGHPFSLQPYFDVWSQESLPLLDGLAGPPQDVNDLGMAAWASLEE